VDQVVIDGEEETGGAASGVANGLIRFKGRTLDHGSD